MKLIMFDIDGTLTATNNVDTECYAGAMAEYLGRPIDTEWAQYRHVTDSGIAAEIFEKHGRRVSEIALVRDRFVRRIAEALGASPEHCGQIGGATEFLKALRARPDVRISLATGGWAASAKAKLDHAGINVDGLEFASADDAESRIDIMKICRTRVMAREPSIDKVIYVGDGLWDAQAARELGWSFVGIGVGEHAARLSEHGARAVFEDYSDQPALMRALVGEP